MEAYITNLVKITDFYSIAMFSSWKWKNLWILCEANADREDLPTYVNKTANGVWVLMSKLGNVKCAYCTSIGGSAHAVTSNKSSINWYINLANGIIEKSIKTGTGLI